MTEPEEEPLFLLSTREACGRFNLTYDVFITRTHVRGVRPERSEGNRYLWSPVQIVDVLPDEWPWRERAQILTTVEPTEAGVRWCVLYDGEYDSHVLAEGVEADTSRACRLAAVLTRRLVEHIGRRAHIQRSLPKLTFEEFVCSGAPPPDLRPVGAPIRDE